MIIPKKIAIYYGYPSLINGSQTLQQAINNFLNYDIVVLGAGLENPSHPDHNNTVNIVNSPQTANILFFGYVDSTLNLSTINTAVDRMLTTGMNGVFCDRFGYDFGTKRTKQNNIVNYIHNKGMIAFVNSWDPDDTFGSNIDPKNNPNQTLPVINGNDWYLIQSFQILNGEYQDPVFWKVRSESVSDYKSTFGTKVACVTTYGTQSFDQNKADYSYYSCVLYNFDAWGWGELYFSAQNSLLPFRSRKQVYGTQFCTSISADQNGVFSRKTNSGINVNTNDHTTSLITNCNS